MYVPLIIINNKLEKKKNEMSPFPKCVYTKEAKEKGRMKKGRKKETNTQRNRTVLSGSPRHKKGKTKALGLSDRKFAAVISIVLMDPA